MSDVLVAYFSASNVTKGVAERLASVVKGDLHRIEPLKPYTQADLDWTDSRSRSSREMKDKTFRPGIANRVDGMEKYNVIYLGFPIWWYVAPTIINSFLEQYDLKGKTIIPFATSGSSQMGKTNEELKGSCQGADLREGKRFVPEVSETELRQWIQGYSVD